MMRSVEQQRQVPTVGPTHVRGVTETGRYQSVTTDASDVMAEGPSPSMDPVQRVVGSFKLGSSPTETGLVPIGLPQLAEPAVDADYIYASMGRCERPIDDRDNGVIMTEFGDERGQALGQDCISENDDAGATATVTEAPIATHLPLLVWTPHGELPREPGYVRLNSARYNEWQVLAYDNAREKELYKIERELYEQWLATQPPAVERPSYVTPREILRRPSEALLEGDIQEWACAASDGSLSSVTDPEVSVDSPRDSRNEIQPMGATTEAADIQPSELDPTEDNPLTAESNTVETLYSYYVCALVGGESDTVDADTTETAEHTATVGGLDDYAHELAFLPDLSEVSVTDLNYTGDNR
ncbi:unnamed protein product [Phytophthora lilii]|uniref:Unnamed protein product n=1 Tax=Phytophthora lilii TaxID=2077276 RepID=A0A9W7CWW9_9STRA|nr:unnamed protein product [Phytophthora lilii]